MLVDENKQLLNNLLKTNLLPLAFIGDAVHTICAREFCLEKFNDKMNNYHLKASFYCKASSQAKTLNKIYTLLNDEEKEIEEMLNLNIKLKMPQQKIILLQLHLKF